MGGMIAQEFALNYPEKTRSLVLAVTDCGGREAVPAKPEVLLVSQGRANSTPSDAFWAMSKFIYDPATPRERLAEDLAARENENTLTAPANYMRQLQAITTWQGTHDRLANLKVPTLVLHGKNDQRIPCANAQILAAAIPNAELVELDHASHIFMTDQPEKSAAAILEFLADK